MRSIGMWLLRVATFCFAFPLLAQGKPPASTAGGKPADAVTTTAPPTSPHPLPSEPELKILRADPKNPIPGSPVTLTLSRPLKMASKLVFGGDESVFQPPQSTLETNVPTRVYPGKTTLVLVEGSNPPVYYEIVIREPKLLGIPRAWLPGAAVSLIEVAVLLGVIFSYRWIRGRAKQLKSRIDDINRLGDARPGMDIESALPAPKVGEELVRLCASGNCILFAGPGLGAQAHLPTHHAALLQIVGRIEISNNLRQQLWNALDDEEYGFVSEAIESQIDHKELIAQLKRCYALEGDISDAHAFLSEIPFAGVLTSSWDHLIDKVFAKKATTIVRGEADAEQALALHQDSFFIGRLRGALDTPGTVVFSSADYQRTVYGRPSFARFVASQVLVHPLFFVGMSLSGISEFFSAFRFAPRSIPTSYALVPYVPLWEVQQQRFLTNYGVNLIFYDPANRHEQMVEFLRELEARVEAFLPEGTAQPGKLRRICLKNIGAFEHLEINELQDGWNVLLGNNGAGKSTILRAIALGLCGDDPEAAIAGGHLLRHSARFGTIELQVGEIVYKTELRRVGNRVLISAQFALPQKGGPLILGFPALRGVSQRDPSGPSAIQATEPRVGDLLPLIRGSIDTRLDSLKQWLVNLAVNSVPGGDITNREAAANKRRMLSFYEILRKFTPGQQVEPGEIDRHTWQVYVKTEDGDVPIDHVSQGMSSIFGWVGTLIQRMYEVNSGDGNATQQPALVLVDEIDAHLHPEWQQVLASIVKEHFPNVQMLATTHSPLLAAGMKQEELLIASREPAEPSRIEVFHSPIDPEGMRADQMLTSPIFGLVSTRGRRTVEEMKQFSELAAMAQRTPAQEAEIEALRKKLGYIFRAGETRASRLRQVTEHERLEAEILSSAEVIANAGEEVQAEARKRLDALWEEAE